MKMIWKWTVNGTRVHRAPKGAKFIAAQMQHHRLCIWFICDDKAATINYQITLVATGVPYEARRVGEYVDTVQLDAGDLVVHVFVKPEADA